MTGLLELYVKTIWTLEENSYGQKNSIHEQMMKRTNEGKQNKSSKNDYILLKVKWTDRIRKQKNQKVS